MGLVHAEKWPKAWLWQNSSSGIALFQQKKVWRFLPGKCINKVACETSKVPASLYIYQQRQFWSVVVDEVIFHNYLYILHRSSYLLPYAPFLSFSNASFLVPLTHFFQRIMLLPWACDHGTIKFIPHDEVNGSFCLCYASLSAGTDPEISQY